MSLLDFPNTAPKTVSALSDDTVTFLISIFFSGIINVSRFTSSVFTLVWPTLSRFEIIYEEIELSAKH